MIKEYPRCEYCGDYIKDEYQSAVVKGESGLSDAHKSCIMELTIGAWNELEARAVVNVPQDAPYDNAHIADPAVRKSLGLDTANWDRAMTAAKLLTGGLDTTTPDDIAARIENAAIRKNWSK